MQRFGVFTKVAERASAPFVARWARKQKTKNKQKKRKRTEEVVALSPQEKSNRKKKKRAQRLLGVVAADRLQYQSKNMTVVMFFTLGTRSSSQTPKHTTTGCACCPCNVFVFDTRKNKHCRLHSGQTCPTS